MDRRLPLPLNMWLTNLFALSRLRQAILAVRYRLRWCEGLVTVSLRRLAYHSNTLAAS